MSQKPPLFHFEKQFPLGEDATEYALLTDAFVEAY
jgi:hypothetical protein